MIVDFHTYLGSEPLGDHHQEAEALVASMDRSHVRYAMVAPLADVPGPVPDAHRALYQATQRYAGRLVPFARLDPRYGAQAIRELEIAVEELGFRGLLLNPATTNCLPYHPGVLPLMRAAAERRLPVLIVTGNAYVGLPEQVALLAEELPELTVVMAHMGSAAHAVRAVELARRYPNLYLETSLQQSPWRLAWAAREIGAGRMVFGSAAPYGAQRVELLKVQAAGLDGEDEQRILGMNAAALLGLAAQEEA